MAMDFRQYFCSIGAASLLLAMMGGLRAGAQEPANLLRSKPAAATAKQTEKQALPKQAIPKQAVAKQTVPKEAQRSVLVTNEADVFAEAPAATIQQVQALEPVPPAEPKSIVPPDLGQSREQPPAIGWPSPPILQEDWPAGVPPHEMHGGHHGSLLQPWFAHTDPNDPYRHVGAGEPLIGTSWLNRPVFVGFFLGGVMCDDLIAGRVLQNNATLLGARLGYDFDHYWGIEGRYAFARANLTDAFGAPLDDPSRNYFVDLQFVYYPWGDSRWRPYLAGGLGFATYRFRDEEGVRLHESLVHMPLGVGLKYYYSSTFTLRVDAFDNISIGDNTLATLHNLSLTAGFEFRFGGRSPSYFPWHGNTTIW